MENSSIDGLTLDDETAKIKAKAMVEVLDSPHIDYRAGRLTVDEVPVERIAREVGTPAYVYSAATIRDQYRTLDLAFAAHPHVICYALKANSNLSVCRLLRECGAGADVVSGGELRRALTVGFDPRRIMMSGVGKTEEEILYAIKMEVLAVNVESEEELDVVARAARRLKRRAGVSVRINPDVDAGTHSHITTGRADNKFGIERSRAMAIYRRIQKEPWLRAVGIQCHIGSQISEVAPYSRALRALLSIVSQLAKQGVRLEFLDIGGGMGICYQQEKPMSVEALARDILPGLSAWPDLRLIVEPGRYLTADAGLLLTRVFYRKETERSRFVIVDAGMNDLLRPALYGAKHPIWPAILQKTKPISLDVVGPVCETADCFVRGARLPWPKAGDLWVIGKAGAYGFSMSSQYNSRPRAAEVLVEGKSYRIIRTRESFEDLVRHES